MQIRQSARRPRRPNVVFLITDDQRFDTINALGNSEIETPNLDYLCQRGVAFTNAYIMGATSGAVCMPSRAVYNTGRSLFRIEGKGERIPPEHTTMGEHFGLNGYYTFGTGKWHSDGDSFIRSFADGANIFLGGMDDHWNMPVCDYPADGVFPEPEERPWDGGTGEPGMKARRFDRVARGVHSTELFARSAIEFLHNYSGDAPFFLYAAFTAPHDPRSAPQSFRTKYDPANLTLPDNYSPRHPFYNGDDGRDEHIVPHPYLPDRIRRETADYYAMVSHYDHWVGEIIDGLKVAGELDNTIIVHTADHGLAVGRHGLMGKQSLYEHSIHVPLLLSGPGIPEDERRDTFVSSVDLFSTLCDLTEFEPPSSAEGHSFRNAMKDSTLVHRDHILTAFLDIHRAVRDRRYKLIEYVVDGVRHTQLFDLFRDPAETVNLANDPAYAGIRSSLFDRLVAWRKEYGDPADKFWEAMN